MKNKLTDNQKLELVNSMKIIESSASSGELEYVLVENNIYNKNILKVIGCTIHEIEEYYDDDLEYIDISGLVFMKVKSVHCFDGNNFINYVPENL